MKLMEELKRQLESGNEKTRHDAQDCLTIANKLMEISDGHIWSSDWRALAKVRWVGKGLDGKSTYFPSEVGKIFLKGINK